MTAASVHSNDAGGGCSKPLSPAAVPPPSSMRPENTMPARLICRARVNSGGRPPPVGTHYQQTLFDPWIQSIMSQKKYVRMFPPGRATYLLAAASRHGTASGAGCKGLGGGRVDVVPAGAYHAHI